MKRLLLVILLAVLSTASAADQDDFHPYVHDKFSIDFGMYFPKRSVNLSVDPPVAAAGDEIDFESAFGLSKNDDLFALNFGWRFGEKWNLGAQYFESDGQRRKALEEDVEWGEYVFGAGTGIAAGIDFALFRAFFGRNFDSSPHHDLGIGLGLHFLEIGAFIEGNAIVNGAQAGFRRETVSASAPLPNIGAWYTRSLSSKWALRLRLDWFGASFDDYDGTLINASAGINYRLFRNFGLGLSYNLFQLDIGVNKDGWRGDVETRYEGLFVHASAYW